MSLQIVANSIMKTTDKEFMTARGQMELPFKKRLGGRIRSGHIGRPQKATKLVADWWFSRMRFDLGAEAQLSIRKVGI